MIKQQICACECPICSWNKIKGLERECFKSEERERVCVDFDLDTKCNCSVQVKLIGFFFSFDNSFFFF